MLGKDFFQSSSSCSLYFLVDYLKSSVKLLSHFA